MRVKEVTPGRGRRAVTLWVVGCLALAGVAATTGFGGTAPAPTFRQAGHWVYNQTLGAVFHIDGASKNVDATVPISGAGRGDQVLQGSTQGYVVDPHQRRVTVFGKSTLTVTSQLSVGKTEQPVGLEVPGGPYLVYQLAGMIVRLGEPPVTVAAHGPLAHPITTTDGTVWAQRTDNGALCKLPRGGHSLSCPATAPRGHAGALTAIDDHPAFVDTVTDTVTPVTAHGLGRPTALGVDLPADAEVAGSDAGGRLPIVSPAGQHGSMLVLVDTSVLGTSKAGAGPIKVALGTGRFGAPATSGGAVAVVDRTAGKVMTFDNRGMQRAVRLVPAGSGDIRLSRGEDGRVYADAADGAHTLVVDGDGSLTPVTVGGKDVPGTATPPGSLPLPPLGGTGTEPPTASQPPATVPAATPGAPRSVEARPGDGRATVTWRPAADNGSAVTSYQVSWRALSGGARSGSLTVQAGDRRVDVTGLSNGVTYVVTVTAHNRVGAGAGADSAPFTPNADAPTGVRAIARADGTVSVSWQAPGTSGLPVAHYSIVASGSDGTRRTLASTGSTATVVSALTLGIRWRFMVAATGPDGQPGPSATSAAVMAFRSPAAPGDLSALRGAAMVDLTWTAPAPTGASLTGYVVTATGQPAQTVTGTTARFAGLTKGTVYTFAVHAVGRDPNTGAPLDGPTATITASPATEPVVPIISVRWVAQGRAAVRVMVDDGGRGPVTCHIIVDLIVSLSHSCAGIQDLVITGLQDDTDYAFQASGTNVIGDGPVSKLVSLRSHHSNQGHIDAARGTPISDGSCPRPSCAAVNVALTGFEHNTTYTITCRSSSSPGGFASYQQRTDDLGYLDGETCRYSRTGDEVWATAVSGFAQSNHVRW